MDRFGIHYAQAVLDFIKTYQTGIIGIIAALIVAAGVAHMLSATLNSSCTAISGFACSDLSYTANGIAFTIRQTDNTYYYGSWIFIASQGARINSDGIPTGFANELANRTAVKLGVIAPGETTTVYVSSSHFADGAIPTNATVGTPLAGYIWLAYCNSPSCGAPVGFVRIATITAVLG